MGDQRHDGPGREGETSIPLHARAGAGAKGTIASPPPYGVEKTKKRIDLLVLLEWAYVREKVHLARDPGWQGAVFNPGWGGRDSSERIGAAVGSSMNLGFVAPADAYAVRDAVAACGAEGLVRNYALTGSTPDWIPNPRMHSRPGKYFAVADPDLKDRRGRPVVVEGWTFFWSGDLPAIVEERRQTYRRWATALARVHAALVGTLRDHELTDRLPAIEPWLDFQKTA